MIPGPGEESALTRHAGCLDQAAIEMLKASPSTLDLDPPLLYSRTSTGSLIPLHPNQASIYDEDE